MKRKSRRLKKKPSKAQLVVVIAVLLACVSGLAYGNANQSAKSRQTAPNVYSDHSTDVIDLSPDTNLPNNPQSSTTPSGNNLNPAQSVPGGGALPDDNITPHNWPPFCRKGVDGTYCAQPECVTAQCRMVQGANQ